MESSQEATLKICATYGSKEWANYLLREGIKVLQDWDREPGSRVLEVLSKIELLESEGYWWQAKVLRNWLHFYWHHLRPEGSTPEGEGGASK